ncbi:hypothetical protein BWK59_14655 [Flavobacterium davisii]|uniref:RHS repeat-associated core domain-containing protein n=1 Tax=Flavobacterium davisii TaxID=2906077 RepID=A0A246GEX9_9FLAO|nr:hypothetical protein BWK59_14655 [Flavobacterium davisii]
MLRRFLNADEHIQDPTNTQCYNKYGYVMNNPLMFSDPDGEYAVGVAIAVAALVAVLSYTVTIYARDGSLRHWKLGDAYVSAIYGAFSGTVTFGVGSIFSAAGGTTTALAESIKGVAGGAGLAVVQAGAHAVTQGVLSSVQGGNFWSAALSGAFGSLGASAFGAIGGDFAKSTLGTITFGAISGGVGAELSGGNFWQGVVIGGMVAGLNHVLHQIDPPGKKGRVTPTLEEANEHYRNGGGKPMTVDASTVDLDFVDTSKMVKGKTYPIQTLTTSKDGRVYGGITVKYLGNNQVSILPDTYNFEQHGSFFSSTFRNTANAIGRWYAGDGTPYKINFTRVNTIHYSPPPVSTYSQTSHGFRF